MLGPPHTHASEYWQNSTSITMPAPVDTLIIDGSFVELSDELAQYIDDIKKKQGVESNLKAEISPLLQQNRQEEALKKLVLASSVLNSAPEKGMLTI